MQPPLQARLQQFGTMLGSSTPDPKKMQINLTSFLASSRQSYQMYGKATFWFGALLSLAEECDRKQLLDDATVSEKIELFKIVTQGLAAITGFYSQQTPNSVFKLLNLMTAVMDLSAQSQDYGVTVARVNYLSAVALYAVKTHQYSFALDTFTDILDLYNARSIDNVNEQFLVAISNYLAFLRRSSKKLTSRLLEVEAVFKDLFVRFFTKSILYEQGEAASPTANLLAGLYRQNEGLLTRHQKDINAVITHFYQQQFKTKRKMPEDMIDFVYKQKVKKTLAFRLPFSADQLHFYSAPRGKSLNVSRVFQKDEEKEKDPVRLNKIEAMLEQSIEMLTEQKIVSARYATLQRNVQTNKASDAFNSFQSVNITRFTSNDPEPKAMHTLQPLPRGFTRKRQALTKPKTVKVPRLKTITFKIHSIFIQVNEDGILLSDYTKQNKRYVQWNTVSLIVEKLEHHFPFEEFMKVSMETYYDFVRVISYYLTKTDNREICLVSKPQPLLEINQLVKLYKQEGKYLKLALMNQYDPDKFVGVVDCYLTEYSEFFKFLNENEYLCSLNEKIQRPEADYVADREDNIYHVDYLKRKRETTVAELSNQLLADNLEHPVEEKGCLYKCIFLLKNNIQLFVKIVDNVRSGTALENSMLEVRMESILGNDTYYLESQKEGKENTRIGKTIEIPLAKLTNYFPSFDLSLHSYVHLYGRMLVDMLNNFEAYVSEINMGGLSFEVLVHACRTQMVEYGKYYSVVSVELVGSRERVWAVVVRWYDLAYCSQKVTVMMNPYHDFLQGAIRATQEEKATIVRNLLVGESVRDTFNWIKKNNRLDRRLNLFEYLNANKMI